MTGHPAYWDKVVVVLDDDADFLEITRGLLRAAGIGTSLGFTDPREALAAFDDMHVDVAILDQRVRGAEGIAIARRVRASDRVVNAVMPIILTTARPSRAVVEKAIRSGVDEVLAKPFSRGVLAARMAALIDRPRTYIRTPGGYFGPDRRRSGPRSAVAGEDTWLDGAEEVTVEHLLQRRREARRKYGRLPPSPLEPPAPVLVGDVTKIPVVSGRGSAPARVMVPSNLRREVASILAARDRDRPALWREADPDEEVHFLD